MAGSTEDGRESSLAPSVAAMLAADTCSQALGIVVEQARAGHARARMTIRADMVNGHGIAHGGLVFALADTAFACACNSDGPATVAAGAEITFARPAHLGDELVAEATVRSSFGRSGICDVTVSRADEVIAEFRGRSHRLSTRAAAEPTSSTDAAVPVESTTEHRG